jgi:hypothetical protein
MKEGCSTSEISRDQERGGSTEDSGRKTAYEKPVLERLGSIGEVTHGTGTGGTDLVVTSQ